MLRRRLSCWPWQARQARRVLDQPLLMMTTQAARPSMRSSKVALDSRQNSRPAMLSRLLEREKSTAHHLHRHAAQMPVQTLLVVQMYCAANSFSSRCMNCRSRCCARYSTLSAFQGQSLRSAGSDTIVPHYKGVTRAVLSQRTAIEFAFSLVSPSFHDTTTDAVINITCPLPLKHSNRSSRS